MLIDGFFFKLKFLKGSLIKFRYNVAFAADFAKFLYITKTFSIFKSVKKNFGLNNVSFAKGLYRTKKLIDTILQNKIENLDYIREKYVRAFQLNFKKRTNFIINVKLIDKIFKKNSKVYKLLVNFKRQLEENTKFINIINKNNKKLLIFNRLLETRAPSIISRTSVIYL